MEIDLTPYVPSKPLAYAQEEWRVWLYRQNLHDAKAKLIKAQRDAARAHREIQDCERVLAIVIKQLEDCQDA